MNVPVATSVSSSQLPVARQACLFGGFGANALGRSLAVGSLLAFSCLVGASVQAQVVNDPATSMLIQNSSRFKPLKDAKDKSVVSDEKPKAEAAKGEIKPLPPGLQPELDLQKTPDAADGATTASSEPIKARAVVVDINSNTLNYDKDHDVYVATGSVHMIISEQNSELFCDKLTYDQNQNLAIAEGNVVIIKDGQRTEGNYAKIDMTRRSALINDTITDISAVRIKAKQSFVNNNEIILENGRLIISGVMYQQLASQGGLSNLGQSAGKGASQAKLRREYSKKVYQNRAKMVNQLSYNQQQLYKNLATADPAHPDFDESPDKLSRFSIKAKEIEIVRHEDGYDEINLKHSSLYAGKYKLFNLLDTDYSYDGKAKNFQYLGPDIGSNRAYGGAYAGPGWDFHLGRGSLRVSPIASFGSPGFWSSDGKSGKQVPVGLGFGGAVHFRDPDTAIDLAYNSHVGSPVFYADRRVYGDSVHFMAAYNDIYQNGLLGQNERPTYIAQLTDYRVLKDIGKFQLSSFESIGYAKDNFYPNFHQTYFVDAKGNKGPQILGRAQLQFQLMNTTPLLSFGKHVSVGMKAQLLTAAYTSSDFIALGRIGPTLNLNLMQGGLLTSLGYTVSHAIGQSPFVFDSYYGGAQNLSVNNLIRINKYLSLGNNGSFSLNRDNAKKALAVGNMMYMLVGPQDIKATIGYDFINSRSYFGFNYFPGSKNTVVNYDKMKIMQPTNFKQPSATSKF